MQIAGIDILRNHGEVAVFPECQPEPEFIFRGSSHLGSPLEPHARLYGYAHVRSVPLCPRLAGFLA
jgi:hypothetical protein